MDASPSANPPSAEATRRLDDEVASLSHGEIRQLEVALTLALSPKLLLLDEPCAGLSPAERASMSALLRRLPDDLTLVMIEHDMNVLREVVDWIAVLHNGQLVTEGPTAEVQKDAAVRELYLGTAAGRAPVTPARHEDTGGGTGPARAGGDQ